MCTCVLREKSRHILECVRTYCHVSYLHACALTNTKFYEFFFETRARTYTHLRYTLVNRKQPKVTEKRSLKQVHPAMGVLRDADDATGTVGKNAKLRFERLFGLCKKHIKNVEHLRLLLDRWQPMLVCSVFVSGHRI